MTTKGPKWDHVTDYKIIYRMIPKNWTYFYKI